MREPCATGEREAVPEVEAHGWHVLKVLEGPQDPQCAYTMGLQQFFGHPELLVFGLPLDVDPVVRQLQPILAERGR